MEVHILSVSSVKNSDMFPAEDRRLLHTLTRSLYTRSRSASSFRKKFMIYHRNSSPRMPGRKWELDTCLFASSLCRPSELRVWIVSLVAVSALSIRSWAEDAIDAIISSYAASRVLKIDKTVFKLEEKLRNWIASQLLLQDGTVPWFCWFVTNDKEGLHFRFLFRSLPSQRL